MIRNWLREWLGLRMTDQFVNDIMGREIPTAVSIARIEKGISELAQASQKDSQRFERLENELAAQEKAHNDAINELRERLESPRSRRPSQPFHVQARMAEIGAIAQRVKDAG